MHSEIALLNEQLQVKDNQLNIKDKQIEQHLQTIQALTGQIDRLTTQIETAHQLNAGNIKALLPSLRTVLVDDFPRLFLYDFCMYNDSEFFDPEIVNFMCNYLLRVILGTTLYYTANT